MQPNLELSHQDIADFNTFMVKSSGLYFSPYESFHPNPNYFSFHSHPAPGDIAGSGEQGGPPYPHLFGRSQDPGTFSRSGC